MPAFACHLFVCCNQREPGNSRGCCDPEGNGKLRELFKAELKKRGLGPLYRANESGCLDQCEYGPVIAIYPQQIWYGHVQPSDVPRIVEETVIHGRILDDLLITNDQLNNTPRHQSKG